MSEKARNVVLTMAVLGCVVSLGGCCTIGLKQCEVQDQLTLLASNDLNNCNDTQSVPVNVRVYYLTQKDRFLNSVFEDLWFKPDEVLGADATLSPQACTVFPGGTETIMMPTRPLGATHIGVVANFCRESGSSHRIFALDKNGLRQTIRLDKTNLVTAGD
jgi:type VI secretion system VasD/TssJ family lipoprotein